MALITCPECGKRVSDMAEICPGCGVPLTEELKGKKHYETFDSSEIIIPCPQSFPSDLSIGQQITNWKFDAAFNGVYNTNENTITSIPNGKIKVLLHTHGVRIFAGVKILDIHNSQIINIVNTTYAQLTQVKKSVIGRAIVGHLIMGPIGAIVGGMSGIGTKDKKREAQYAVINFWDIETRAPQSIVIQCDANQPIEAFIARQQQENTTNIEEDRIAEKEHIPIWMLTLIIIVITFLFILFLTS